MGSGGSMVPRSLCKMGGRWKGIRFGVVPDPLVCPRRCAANCCIDPGLAADALWLSTCKWPIPRLLILALLDPPSRHSRIAYE